MKDCCSSNKDKKVMDYVVIAIVFLLLVGSVVVGFEFKNSADVVVENDLNLEQYRTEGIPVDCRLPTYEKRIESWKEHLGHHEDTLYCLEYFK